MVDRGYSEIDDIEKLFLTFIEYRKKYESISDTYYKSKDEQSYHEWLRYVGVVNGIDSCQRALISMMCKIGKEEFVRQHKWQ